MKTEVLGTATPEALEAAIACAVGRLKSGDIVALPTETVYGLAADATDVAAVLRIFEAKARPRFDPLIVHLPSPSALNSVIQSKIALTEIEYKLTEHFWPGPFTLVLSRNSVIPDIVVSGLPTVALRVSAHPLFGEIVRRLGRPIAAPSANRFGNVSPTSAADVLAELEFRIPLIVDGGRTEHGVESTIVAVRDGRIEILRPGPITEEQLREFAPVHRATNPGSPDAPGQLPSHYAPTTPMILCDDLALYAPHPGRRIGALAWREPNELDFAESRVLSRSGDLREAGANLFRQLRELDAANLDLIVAEAVPEVGLGHAIMDRLRRAATKR